MQREQIKAIVEAVVHEYFSRKKSTPKLFVLLVGRANSTEQESVRQILKELVLINEESTIATCSIWHQAVESLKGCRHIKLDALEGEQEEQLVSHVEKADLLVLPHLTRSMLAKLSLSIDDTLPAWLVVQAQLKGKRIVIATDHVEGNLEQWLSIPKALEEKAVGYRQQLQRDGVKLTSLKNLPVVIQEQGIEGPKKRPILLAKHVDRLAERGVPYAELPDRTLITPLARDRSKELKIKLSPQRKGGFNDRS